MVRGCAVPAIAFELAQNNQYAGCNLNASKRVINESTLQTNARNVFIGIIHALKLPPARLRKKYLSI